MLMSRFKARVVEELLPGVRGLVGAKFDLSPIGTPISHIAVVTVLDRLRFTA